MSEGKKKLSLAIIAKKKGLSQEEILLLLISQELIYAHVENVTLSNSMISREFAITDLPIPESYLYIIWSKEKWEGNKIQIRSFEIETGKSRIDEATFSKDIRIGIEDLFVYEDDLTALEAKQSDIFTRQETTISPKEEASLYFLIGVFLDMLVDRKEKNYSTESPTPDADSKFVFKSQSQLINYIKNAYEIHGKGLGVKSLEGKFSKANTEFDKVFDKIKEEDW